jgi:hypothetical protein
MPLFSASSVPSVLKKHIQRNLDLSREGTRVFFTSLLPYLLTSRPGPNK